MSTFFNKIVLCATFKFSDFIPKKDNIALRIDQFRG